MMKMINFSAKGSGSSASKLSASKLLREALNEGNPVSVLIRFRDGETALLFDDALISKLETGRIVIDMKPDEGAAVLLVQDSDHHPLDDAIAGRIAHAVWRWLQEARRVDVPPWRMLSSGPSVLEQARQEVLRELEDVIVAESDRWLQEDAVEKDNRRGRVEDIS